MTDTAAGPSARCTWTVTADSARLRELRRQRGLTQQALARHAGVSAATITRLENQPGPTCRGRTLARLAAALGAQTVDVIPPPRPAGQAQPRNTSAP